MAKEGENPEAKEGEASSATKKGLFTKGNLILFSLLIVLLGGGVFGAIKMLSSGEESKKKKETEAKAADLKFGKIYEFPTIVVNVAGTQGTRYLKTTIGVEMLDDKVQEELKNREIQILDLLNSICGAKTLLELDQSKIRLEIKKSIRDSINGVLQKGKVREVFFKDFVVQ